MYSRTVAVFLVLICSCSLQGETRKLKFHTAQSMILVDLAVNGKPVTMLLDTGAISSLIALRLTEFGSSSLPGMRQGHTDQGFIGQAYQVKAKFDFGGVHVPELTVFAGNVDELSHRAGTRCDGILGLDMLRRFKSVKIDYASQEIELEPLPEALSVQASSLR
jgi:hypothetical protein